MACETVSRQIDLFYNKLNQFILHRVLEDMSKNRYTFPSETSMFSLKFTNSMEANPSSETNTYPATQEISSISLEPMIHYHHRSLSQCPLFIILRYIFILSSHLHHGLPNGPLLSGFIHNILCSLFSHMGYMPCPSQSPCLDLSNNIWQRKQFTPMKVFIIQFSLYPPVTSSHLGPNILFITLFSNTLG
jgi:hypothetical protein